MRTLIIVDSWHLGQPSDPGQYWLISSLSENTDTIFTRDGLIFGGRILAPCLSPCSNLTYLAIRANPRIESARHYQYNTVATITEGRDILGGPVREFKDLYRFSACKVNCWLLTSKNSVAIRVWCRGTRLRLWVWQTTGRVEQLREYWNNSRLKQHQPAPGDKVSSRQKRHDPSCFLHKIKFGLHIMPFPAMLK